MGKKKWKPTQLQINGIIWIAILLLTILVIKLFSSDRAVATAENDSVGQAATAFLEKKEDSVYRSRRTKGDEHPPHATHHSSLTTHHSSLTTHHSSLTTHHSSLTTHHYYTSEPPAPMRRPLTVELNSADTTTLMLLNGIGPAFARRIVRYRDRLGGFVALDQLLEVYGFTPDLLAHIAPHLALDSANHSRIAVNSVPLKQFIKHPYVDYYFARDVVNLRSRGVQFLALDDLRAVPSATDTMLARLLPYLDFSAPQ